MMEQRYIDPNQPALQFWRLPRWLIKTSLVSNGAMTIYSILVGTTYDEPYSKVSLEFLVKESGLKRRMVQYHLGELVEVGLIKRVPDGKSQNTWLTFFLWHDAMPSRDVTTIAREKEEEGGGGCKELHPRGAINCTPEVQRIAPTLPKKQPQPKEEKGVTESDKSPIESSYISSLYLPPSAEDGVYLPYLVKDQSRSRKDWKERVVVNIYIYYYWKHYGRTPIITGWGKTMAIAGSIVRKFPDTLDPWVQLARAFFQSTDQWIQKSGHPLALLASDTILQKLSGHGATPAKAQLGGHGLLT